MFKELWFIFPVQRLILFAITSLLSGQVGISESGIDDAVQKLVACG